jgi:hypothetical protein
MSGRKPHAEHFAAAKGAGESPGGIQFIETVPRRGYRFVADINEAWDGGHLKWTG